MPRLTLVGLFLLACVVSATAQSSSPQRDPSAIAFLNQAVSAAGGVSTISVIQDFTAQGSITHFWGDSTEQGNLTVKARGLAQFRLDSVLPEGTWLFIANNGAGELVLPDGTVASIPYHNTINVGSLTWPISKVSAALSDATVTITDLGLVTFGSGQARQIRIQQATISPLSAITRCDYFFDPVTSLLFRVQDKIHPNNDSVNGAIVSRRDFANYQAVNGVMVPFSIRQSVAGQQTWTIQLTSIAFNTGLSDTDFQF